MMANWHWFVCLWRDANNVRLYCPLLTTNTDEWRPVPTEACWRCHRVVWLTMSGDPWSTCRRMRRRESASFNGKCHTWSWCLYLKVSLSHTVKLNAICYTAGNVKERCRSVTASWIYVWGYSPGVWGTEISQWGADIASRFLLQRRSEFVRILTFAFLTGAKDAQHREVCMSREFFCRKCLLRKFCSQNFWTTGKFVTFCRIPAAICFVSTDSLEFFIGILW